MLKGWIIYRQADASKNQAFISRFFDKQQTYQMQFELVFKEQLAFGASKEAAILVDGYKQALPDFVIMRTIDPVLSQLFTSLNIQVFNSLQVASMANHKFLTHLEMRKLQIPMLPTYFFKNEQLLQGISLPIPFPFVCKACEGHGGKDVYLIRNFQELQSIPTLQTVHDWIIQPLAPVIGRDLRVFVIGKQIIGAILRKNIDDFRANFSLSQTAAWYDLQESELQLIKKIMDAFDFDFVGIDFLFDHAGNLIFNEIEDVVGSRTLSIYSDVDAVDLYLQHIQKKCYSFL